MIFRATLGKDFLKSSELVSSPNFPIYYWG